MKKQRNRGFTLIELLVVIAIIGVLASIVLASLNTARRKSRDARRVTDIKQLQLALELYFDGTNPAKYPPANTTACVPATPATRRGLEALSAGGYIPQVPIDPNGTACYSYSTPAEPANTYHLGATLEESGNPALNSDRDCDSTIAPGSSGSCGFTQITGTGFDGAGLVYDVVP